MLSRPFPDLGLLGLSHLPPGVGAADRALGSLARAGQGPDLPSVLVKRSRYDRGVGPRNCDRSRLGYSQATVTREGHCYQEGLDPSSPFPCVARR